MRRGLLLSGYDASSHARWARGLMNAWHGVEWTYRALPARHFKWRLRGNAWWWALEEPAIHERYDVLVATSMVDLAALIGLVPSLGDAEKVAYFHENQFAYPTQGEAFDMHLGMSNLYTALAADRVWFNSEYNRQTMLEGVRWMAQQLPDFTPRRTVDLIASRSEVVPVGLEDHWFDDGPGERTGPLQIVWNHRWEFDKAPERLFAALNFLEVDFELHVVGQQFRQIPPAFEAGRQALGSRIKSWGFVESADAYRQLLRRCDVVVSTALHEFQGLAVLEAVASGCVAAAPARLAYPEFLPEHFLFDSFPDDPDREARRLARHLTALAGRLGELRAAAPWDLEHLRWSRIGQLITSRQQPS